MKPSKALTIKKHEAQLRVYWGSMSFSAKYKSSVVANYAEKGNNYQFKLINMKMSIKLFLFASLCFFTSCYKQKACFDNDIISGEIVENLGKEKGGNSINAELYDLESDIYINESSYLKDVNENGVYGFKNIDFIKYSLLKSCLSFTKNSYVHRNVNFDTINKVVHFTVIETKSLKRFSLSNRIVPECTYLLIIKVSNDYKLKTEYKEESCK